MTDTPAHDLEPVWLIEATYAPDAAETRVPVRARHLARLARLKAEGTAIEAGGLADVSRSLVLVRASDADEAMAIARDDPYLEAGVWVEVRVHAFGRVRLATEAEAATR